MVILLTIASIGSVFWMKPTSQIRYFLFSFIIHCKTSERRLLWEDGVVIIPVFPRHFLGPFILASATSPTLRQHFSAPL